MFDGETEGKIMDFFDNLKRKLNATLQPINHESLNKTFVGYSKYYQKNIFVKAFKQEQKFYTEKMVNEELNDRVLASFPMGSKWILVMTDIAPQDIKEKLNKKLAFKMGQELGKFHKTIKPFPKITRFEVDFSGEIEEINRFEDTPTRSELILLSKHFLANQEEIKQDIITHSNVILHGDVGLRNYKYVDHNLRLIDFERAKVGPAYLDFIKLFYQDFGLKEDLISAFLKGYQSKKIDYQLDPLTKMYLIYASAVGIMNYTEKISDPKFRAIGLKMINDVKEYFKGN